MYAIYVHVTRVPRYYACIINDCTICTLRIVQYPTRVTRVRVTNHAYTCKNKKK